METATINSETAAMAKAKAEPNMSIYLSIYSETSATPEVARTCRQEQPIEDIGSTGRVNESSRLSVTKLKLNGVRNVYQTCQGDVKTCQSSSLSIYSETSATPEVARTCRQEQPIEDIGSTGRVNESSRLSVTKLKLNGVRNVYQTCQGDVKTCQSSSLSIYSETSATPEVARTCRQEQRIEDIGSTGRVNESSRLSVTKLKLNGVRNVYQTCQGDVKTCQSSSLSIYSETSATPEVARTCRQEQPIEDIGSTGRVNESSRLSVAKLKLNGVRNVYQTCQGDVKTCQSSSLSIRRHLLHRKLHGHADKSNRLKISEAPAE